jgi:hypothetical protein
LTGEVYFMKKMISELKNGIEAIYSDC